MKTIPITTVEDFLNRLGDTLYNTEVRLERYKTFSPEKDLKELDELFYELEDLIDRHKYILN